MSEEGKDDVVKITPSEEGVIPKDKDGKYPEVVSWTQHVGVKEMLTKAKTRAEEAEGKVTSLEEKLKGAVTPEEAAKVTTELTETKAKLETAVTELKTVKEGTLTEKRTALVKVGVAEEKVKDMSVEQLDALIGAIGNIKVPKPDLGGGGGGEPPTKAKAKISSGFEALHPQK